jgi:hypothetical protein
MAVMCQTRSIGLFGSSSTSSTIILLAVLKRVGNCLVLLFGVVDLVLFRVLQVVYAFVSSSTDVVQITFGLVAELVRLGFLKYVWLYLGGCPTIHCLLLQDDDHFSDRYRRHLLSMADFRLFRAPMWFGGPDAASRCAARGRWR